ncbi:MAG: hypothetical protein OJF51_004133 [Nitrospira sp.]|nr:MAG: hypothetical protein OJF51_004133 [Nitrospira sp.]
MAIARSCLTLWVYRILVPMFFDPQMTRISHRSVRGVDVSIGLVQVS